MAQAVVLYTDPPAHFRTKVVRFVQSCQLYFWCLPKVHCPGSTNVTINLKTKKRVALFICHSLILTVGMTGFEPATTRPPDVYATGLRHIPIDRPTYFVGSTGFEPVTSTMSTWRSNQLSYDPNLTARSLICSSVSAVQL
jgi:hypothetical protein